MLACVILLVALGCLMVYSCTYTKLAREGISPTKTLRTQLMWVLIGIAAMLVMMCIDYTRIASFHLPIYGLILLLLVVVLFMPERNGATRWIFIGPFTLQPSEFAQLAMVIVLAQLCGAQEPPRDFISLTKSFAWLVPVLVLILMEPDLGTPVVMCFTWAAMVFVGGARLTHMAGYAWAGLLLFLAAWFSGVVSQYQKDRLLSFWNLKAHRTGDGYHQFQSLIAIGKGGLFGEGLFKGEWIRLEYIPDQHTDFIFTAVAEELGFVGAAAVLALFAVLLWRCTVVMFEAKDPLGRLLAGGVTTMVGMHVAVNIGMTMGLGPVKGMPLPLVSYGGSNMLVTLMAIGLIQSVHMRRHKIAF